MWLSMWPTLVSALVFVSLLQTSYSAQIPGRSSRQLVLSDIEGSYTSTSETGAGTCPSDIFVGGLAAPASNEDYTISSASQISINGAACPNETFIIVTSQLAQDQDRLLALTESNGVNFKVLSDLIASNSAANGTLTGVENAKVSVGFFNGAVTCGDYPFSPTTVIFFLATTATESQVVTITPAANVPAQTTTIERSSKAFISTDGTNLCIAQDAVDVGNDNDDRDLVIPQATPEPMASPSPSPTDDESATELASVEPTEPKPTPDCFPSSATVELGSGLAVPISTLNIGDTVRTGVDSMSEVILFTHREGGSINNFLEITTAAGRVLTMSAGHYVHVASHGRLIPASEVKIGNRLLLGSSGAWSQVTSRRWVKARGLYNPQTLDGNIVVNGVVASTYTTAVHPQLAHRSLMAPVRWIYRMPFQSTRVVLGVLFANGSPLAASILPSGPHEVIF